MGRKVFVVGVGMTKFEKPGSKEWDYPDMAEEAGNKALADAGIPYSEIQQAAVGYCYGDSTAGERAFYELGHSGIPIYNVNNNCSTGSTALFMAKQFIEGDISDCVMALGFEKMEKGSLGMKYTDRTNPMDKHFMKMNEQRGFDPKAPPAAQFFGNAGREHMERYGTTAEQFAKIAYKNHKHSVNNPYSQFQDEYSLEDIMNAPMIFDPLSKLQCCPTSDGAGAAVVASEDFVKKHGLQDQAVEIVGMAMTTDFESTFDDSSIKLVGSEMTRRAGEMVFEQSGFGPENVDVVELHDCFATAELVHYDNLMLCDEGNAVDFFKSGATWRTGTTPVNVSGGLQSKGHPIAATGIANVWEVCHHLRGEAGPRQIEGAKVGLAHVIGLASACGVHILESNSA